MFAELQRVPIPEVPGSWSVLYIKMYYSWYYIISNNMFSVPSYYEEYMCIY